MLLQMSVDDVQVLMEETAESKEYQVHAELQTCVPVIASVMVLYAQTLQCGL